VILDSKTTPLENLRDCLLRSLLVLLTKKPRKNPKNKNNNICLGRFIKGIVEKFSSGIRNINKNNPHFILYKERT
jgi:hypothetical protein